MYSPNAYKTKGFIRRREAIFMPKQNRMTDLPEKYEILHQCRQLMGSSYGFTAVGRRYFQVLPVVLCIVLHFTVLPWPKYTLAHIWHL